MLQARVLTFGAWLCAQRITAEIVLWTAGFVLLTLVLNAPLLPLVLRISGLSKGDWCRNPPKGGEIGLEEHVRMAFLRRRIPQLPGVVRMGT